MRATTALGSAAGLIAALGLAAAFTGPSGLRKPPQGAPWPGLGRVDASASWPGVSGSDTNPTALFALALRAAIASQQAIEQASPAIGADGVLVEDFGIESPAGAFLALLQRGRPVPSRHVLTFTTTTEGTNEFRLHFLRGTSARAADDHSLGWFRIGGLPPATSGGPRALVVFSAIDGALWVGAAGITSGQALALTPSEPGAMVR